MDEIMASQNVAQESAYVAARNSVINAQRKVYTAVNNSMVQAYWEIGEQIYLRVVKKIEQNMGRVCYNIFHPNLQMNLEKVFQFRT